jgi:hypothetical protein
MADGVRAVARLRGWMQQVDYFLRASRLFSSPRAERVPNAEPRAATIFVNKLNASYLESSTKGQIVGRRQCSLVLGQFGAADCVYT